MHYSNASQPQNYATASNCWVKSMPGSNRSNNALRCACPNNPINQPPLRNICLCWWWLYKCCCCCCCRIIHGNVYYYLVTRLCIFWDFRKDPRRTVTRRRRRRRRRRGGGRRSSPDNKYKSYTMAINFQCHQPDKVP